MNNKKNPPMDEVKYTYLELINKGYELLNLDKKKNVFDNNDDFKVV